MGTQPPPHKGVELPPQFSEVDLGPGHTVLDGVSAPAKGAQGAQQPLSFRPMSIVAKVAHLSYC